MNIIQQHIVTRISVSFFSFLTFFFFFFFFCLTRMSWNLFILCHEPAVHSFPPIYSETSQLLKVPEYHKLDMYVGVLSLRIGVCLSYRALENSFSRRCHYFTFSKHCMWGWLFWVGTIDLGTVLVTLGVTCRAKSQVLLIPVTPSVQRCSPRTHTNGCTNLKMTFSCACCCLLPSLKSLTKKDCHVYRGDYVLLSQGIGAWPHNGHLE
jgi:hypothetical protein